MTNSSKYTGFVNGQTDISDLGRYEVVDVDSWRASVRAYELSIKQMIEFEQLYKDSESGSIKFGSPEIIDHFLSLTIRDFNGDYIFDGEDKEKLMSTLAKSDTTNLFNVAFKLNWPDDAKKKD